MLLFLKCPLSDLSNKTGGISEKSWKLFSSYDPIYSVTDQQSVHFKLNAVHTTKVL